MENNEFEQLQAELENAVKNGESPTPYIEKQIECIQKAHDEFVSKAKLQGHSLNEVSVVEIELEQFFLMKDLATLIGQPTDKYDEMIKEARIRIFGEENYKQFFVKREI